MSRFLLAVALTAFTSACVERTSHESGVPDAGQAARQAVGADAPTAPGSFRFVEAGPSAGLTAPTWCGRPEKPHLLESGGSGLGLIDYDSDGDLDLYLVSGWRLEGSRVLEKTPNRLYRNDGSGRFEDVTEQAGVGDEGWGCGVAVGDADGDGRPDLFVSNFGPDALYLNRGDGRFERAEEPPGLDGWSASAVFFDADGDGDQDLFVTAYVDCSLQDVLDARPTLDWKETKVMLGPFGLEGAANGYFVNEGGGRFREATEEAGLEDVGLFYSFGVAAADLDGDADLDLYVANDSNPNYLYRNDGHGHFNEVGLWSGAALDVQGAGQAGMGLALGDSDGDGDLEMFVTNFELDASTLYLNEGSLLFSDVSAERGLREPTYAALSWGTAFADFDLDGDLDLFVANGHIYPQADSAPAAETSFRQANLLLENRDGRFTDVSAAAGPGLAVVASSRGLAVGDLDGDGDLDLAISNMDEPPTLLLNESERRGAWLVVDAPGARRVVVETAGRRQVRDAVHGSSFCSASDSRFHFGLGPVTRLDALSVTWSDGRVERLEDVEVDRVVRLGAAGR